MSDKKLQFDIDFDTKQAQANLAALVKQLEALARANGGGGTNAAAAKANRDAQAAAKALRDGATAAGKSLNAAAESAAKKLRTAAKEAAQAGQTLSRAQGSRTAAAGTGLGLSLQDAQRITDAVQRGADAASKKLDASADKLARTLNTAAQALATAAQTPSGRGSTQAQLRQAVATPGGAQAQAAAVANAQLRAAQATAASANAQAAAVRAQAAQARAQAAQQKAASAQAGSPAAATAQLNAQLRASQAAAAAANAQAAAARAQTAQARALAAQQRAAATAAARTTTNAATTAGRTLQAAATGMARSIQAAGSRFMQSLRSGGSSITAGGAIGAGVGIAAAGASAAALAGAEQREYASMARFRIYADGDQEKARAEYEWTMQQAERLGIKFSELSTEYSKFAVAAKSAGTPSEAIRQTFLGVAEAAKVMGLSANDTSLAFMAVTQMAGKGKVSMEELRQQLGERIPIAMKAAADATGLSMAEFLEKLEKGSLATGQFFPAFAEELRKFAEVEVANASRTLDSELQRMSSAWDQLLRQVVAGDVGGEMANSVRGLTAALNDPAVAEALRTLAQGLAGLATSAVEGLPGMVDSWTRAVSLIQAALGVLKAAAEEVWVSVSARVGMAGAALRSAGNSLIGNEAGKAKAQLDFYREEGRLLAARQKYMADMDAVAKRYADGELERARRLGNVQQKQQELEKGRERARQAAIASESKYARQVASLQRQGLEVPASLAQKAREEAVRRERAIEAAGRMSYAAVEAEKKRAEAIAAARQRAIDSESKFQRQMAVLQRQGQPISAELLENVKQEAIRRQKAIEQAEQNALKSLAERPTETPARAQFTGLGGGAGSGSGSSRKDALLAADKAYAKAQADASRSAFRAQMEVEEAELESSYKRRLITEADYLQKKQALELRAIAEERQVQQSLRDERKRALDETLAKANSDAKNRESYLADARRVEAELIELDAQLAALESRETVIKIGFKTELDSVAEAATEAVAELDRQFKERSGDRFGAREDDIRARLAKDSQGKSGAERAALERNASQDLQLNALERATDAARKEAAKVEAVIADQQLLVRQGAITQISADREIAKAREEALEPMRAQIELARELADVIGDPALVQQVQELGRTFRDVTTSVDETWLSARDGLIRDAKDGLRAIIVEGEKASDVLKRLAANFLQVYADKYFDLGVDALMQKTNKGPDAGAVGQDMAQSFINGLSSGWGAIQQLFSSLWDGLSNVLSGALSGGGGGGGDFISSIASFFTGGFGARAAGGAVQPGKGYLTGERGIEAFFPGQAGNIVPTWRLEQVLSGLMGRDMPVAPSIAPRMDNVAVGGPSNIDVQTTALVAAEDFLTALEKMPAAERWVTRVMARNSRSLKR